MYGRNVTVQCHCRLTGAANTANRANKHAANLKSKSVLKKNVVCQKNRKKHFPRMKKGDSAVKQFLENDLVPGVRSIWPAISGTEAPASYELGMGSNAVKRGTHVTAAQLVLNWLQPLQTDT